MRLDERRARHALPRLLWLAPFVFVATTLAVASLPARLANDGPTTPEKGWPQINGDWTNARYSPLAQINVQNVSRLGGAWVSEPFETAASSRSAPVVAGGRMFVTAGTGVYALSPKTGSRLWVWRSDVGSDKADAHILEYTATAAGIPDVLNLRYGLPSAFGVAVGEGLVFVGQTNGSVAALNQATGQEVWSVPIGDDPPQRGESVTAPVLYSDGTVFAGLANGDWMIRGRVVALDARTGRKRWEFFMVPGPGDTGHDTWPRESDIWNRGGAGVWLTPALDRELGLLYWVTGNPTPELGGDARPGDNLFADSVVALDVKTGQLRWHFQLVHHNIWNTDLRNSPVLFEAEIGGRARKALAVMRTDMDGVLFLLDRKTGTPLVPVEERPVPQDRGQRTSATQPFPAHADRFAPDCAPLRDSAKPLLPRGIEIDCDPFVPRSLGRDNILAMEFGGGVGWVSYSAQTGYFYVHGTTSFAQRRRYSDDPWLQGHGADTGISLLGLPRVTVMAAIDGRTNRIVWRKEIAPEGVGGALTTAGGLLFRRAGDGNVEADDARTGDRMWQFQIGSTRAQGPAVTYEEEGEQYVAMSWGRRVGAFKLGGTLPPRPPPVPLHSEAALPPATGTTEIGTAALRQQVWGSTTERFAMDEYAFNPLRARVTVGARVTFVNNGRVRHTLTARDGSWTTGPLSPEMRAYVTFKQAGTFMYGCEEHPWSIGHVVVVPPNE